MNPARTIRAKLVLTVSLTLLVVALFQLAWFPRRQAEDAREALQAKAVAVAQLVAYTLAPALDFGDTEVIAEVFKGASMDPDVLYLALDVGDSRLHVSGSGQIPPPSATHAGEGGLVLSLQEGELQVLTPVSGRAGTSGRLVAGFSTAPIDRAQAEFFQVTVLSSALIAVLGAGVAMFLGYSIGSRMREVAAASVLVAEGRLDLPPLSAGSDDEIGQVAKAFNLMVARLSTLEQHVQRVAQGDLTQQIDLPGALPAAMATMVAAQRELVAEIAATAAEIRATSTQMLAACRVQQDGGQDQAAVVQETIATMDALLSSATEIARRSQQVKEYAGGTLVNNRSITERISELAQHTERIGEFLEVIKDIANKAELLALNAALEGTRAGEAGRGFSLVANQMQSLTENVMHAVRDIKEITADITAATSSTVLATEEATKRASDTNASAEQIGLTIRQQASGTEQVSASMGQISQVIRASAAASDEVAQAAAQLEHLSERLQSQVARFDLHAGWRS